MSRISRREFTLRIGAGLGSAAAIFSALPAWARGRGASEQAANPSTPRNAVKPLTPADRAWVEETLRRMSVRELAAQSVMIWMPGNYVANDDEGFKRRIANVDRGVGGLWVMGGLPYERAAKINALQRRAKIPLLVMGDGLEGMRLYSPHQVAGIVDTLGGGTDVPPPIAYGAIGDPEAVREAGRIAGEEARAVGSHFLFVPANVLGDLTNVLLDRTFSDDPQAAADLAEAFIEGAREKGALSNAGHFPGAGGLAGDPHVTIPVLTADTAELEARDWIPLRRAIQCGTALISTSHIAAPHLTGSDTLPMTLSARGIGVLRHVLGYQGLIISDSLAMDGLTSHYDYDEMGWRCFQAGHDIVLGPNTQATIDGLAKLVERGEVPVDRLRASARRLLEAKARLGLHRNRLVNLDALPAKVGTRAHQQAAADAAKRSIVLLHDPDQLVPLRHPARRQLISVTLAREDNRTAGQVFDAALRAEAGSLNRFRLTPASAEKNYDAVVQATRAGDLVMFCVHLPPRNGRGSVDLPEPVGSFLSRVHEKGAKVALISFGKMDQLDTLSPDVFLLAWSGERVCQTAAAHALLGKAPITGKLPITLPRYKHGAGLVRK
jgi:beta-N-acetylhexosaminidase